MAFLTASRAYGMPTAESDIDLAVLVTPNEARLLREMSDTDGKKCSANGIVEALLNREDNELDFSLRFNSLNLLVFTNPEKYEAWQLATRFLKYRQPVTREQAINVIEAFERGDEAAAFAFMVEECYAAGPAPPVNAEQS